MSAPIASKNLYDLLGNDPELDPDREPEPPTKAIDKPVARTGKRNGPAEPPARVADASRSTRGGQRDGNSNDSAFKDRGVGSNANRSRGSGEPPSEYRGRGGRGGRGGRRGGPHAPYSGDRHSRTGVVDTEKQVAHGWGGATGGDEWADEKAGEAIAKEDEKTEGVPADADAAEEPAAEAEPEDKTKSYDEYLAELAQKKLGLSANVRKANEGTSKSFPEGKPLNRDDEEDAYIAGSGGKAKRERERKQKTLVELDDSRLHSAPRETFGGRGRGRGRGEFRGGEGRGRGGRGRGEARGRGGRGQSSGGAGPNVTDTRAFPSLGA